MSILSVDNLTKNIGEKKLFNGISFTISEKQRIGLVGINGTGKSTLLKTIAGLETADEGKIIHPSHFLIEYLPQYPILDDNLTVLEQIYCGDSVLIKTLRDYEQILSELEMDPANTNTQKRFSYMQQKMDELNAWDTITAAKTILTCLKITNFLQPVSVLSGGQRKRVAIAKALIQPADLLILDEPTNHLDNEIIEWLEGYLLNYTGALLVVTHDRYFLNHVTNQIFELDEGKLYTYDGNYQTFLVKKAEREEHEIVSERKRQNYLRQELAWLRRGAKARTTKQKARIQRLNDLQNQKKSIANEKLDMAIGSNRLGRKVLELKGISKAYDNNKLINDLNLLIVPEDRLGIIGPNGSGKSTLLNIMAGKIKPDSGVVDVGETVKIGYYTQECVEMNLELRIIDYIKEVAEVVKTADNNIITAEQMLERFLFPRNTQWTYIKKLSGGERRRLYLLRILMEEPNVLFLDEPTNDLDTITLSILEDYLQHFPGAVITVSHDRFFLDRVVDHLIAFERSTIRLYQGNYAEYLEESKLDKVENAPKEKTVSKTTQNKERRKKLSYKEQVEWNGIEDKISALEERNFQLEQEINLAGSDFEKIQQLYNEQQLINKELEEAMERWTQLAIMVEEIEQGINK